MATVTKLANKLPRLALPTAKYNGAVLPMTTDPYLDEAISWGANTKLYKTIGQTFPSGNAVQVFLAQNAFAGLAGTKFKAYVETQQNFQSILSIAGVDGYVLPDSGNYIVEFPAVGNPTGVAFRPYLSYYAADPYFKLVPVGQLPALSAAVAPSWCGRVSNAQVRKDTDGRLRLKTALTGQYELTHKNNIPNNTLLDMSLTIDYIPPGCNVGVQAYATTIYLPNQTKPGTYTFKGLWLTAAPIVVVASGPVGNEVIISNFQIKASEHSGPMPDTLFIKPSCIFAAEASLFDEIISPSTRAASNYVVPGGNLASQVQRDEPQIGYAPYLPPVGQYRKGDTIRNTNPVSGQPIGWRCTADGNPGTWAAFPSLP